MNSIILTFVLAGCLSLCLCGKASAIEYRLRGQASGWYIEASDEGDRLYSAGIRYIPELDLTQELSAESFVDLEVSANLWAALASVDPGDTSADYTLALGNGLHSLLEHMATAISNEGLSSGWGDVTHISALKLGYPSGYLDYFNLIGYQDWDRGDLYAFASWQRTWDNFALNVSLFHNPERLEECLRSMSARGTGGQVIVVLNH
jgi:hypothetical protein